MTQSAPTSTDAPAKPALDVRRVEERLETNFLSVTIYVNEKVRRLPEQLTALTGHLMGGFANFDITLINDSSVAIDRATLKDAIGLLGDRGLTILSMGRAQGLEAAMNAGTNAAVGDYLLEIDDIDAYDQSFLTDGYRLLMEGNDIVVGAASGKSKRGSIFYRLFNAYSGSPNKIGSDICRFVSRRAINRVHSMTEYMPYRKVAYALSGLPLATITLTSGHRAHRANLDLAVDALTLYTNIFYRISFGLSVVLAAISLAELIYIVIFFFVGNPIEGWTTTVSMMTLGFFGVFVLMTFILKYLSLLLRLRFHQKHYLVESLEHVVDE